MGTLQLFSHTDVTAHLISQQITTMDNPGFQNECYDRMFVLAYFVFIKDFVIEKGSN